MAKKTSNDKTILDLKKTIAEKKALLKGSERFKPKTNCSLELDGVRTNLHVADSATLTLLLLKLSAYLRSAKDLAIEASVIVGGSSLQDWIDDIQSRLMSVNRQREEARLKVLEEKLHELLSAETKTELLINDIQGLI